MTNHRFIYAPLALIRSALCPLTFRAKCIADLRDFSNTVQKVPAFGELTVGNCLRYESLFPYTDRNKHRGYGCQIVAAPVGLSPEDIDALFGIYTYLRRLDRGEGIPADRTVTLTVTRDDRTDTIGCSADHDITFRCTRAGELLGAGIVGDTPIETDLLTLQPQRSGAAYLDRTDEGSYRASSNCDVRISLKDGTIEMVPWEGR